jgi:hypothetical protein
VKLNLTTRDLPPHDAFAAAIDLGGEDTAAATGFNGGASTEIGEPSHYSFDAPAGSVWYSWTAPKRGSVTLKAQGAPSQVLAAYTGSAVSNLTRVPNQAQDWSGGPEQIRIRVEAGQTYRFVVAARYADGGGDFSLSLTRIDTRLERRLRRCRGHRRPQRRHHRARTSAPPRSPASRSTTTTSTTRRSGTRGPPPSRPA